MEPEENNCLISGHRLSPIAYHHINKNTMIPIVVCYDCNSLLPQIDIIISGILKTNQN